MPSVIRGGSKTSLDLSTVPKGGYDYTYPFDLDLKPGSEIHDRLRDRIMDRAWESRESIGKRFASWRKIDEVQTAYIPTSDAEKRVKDADERKPVSIVVPTMYANHQILLTYHVAALLESPICRYEGVGPEDVYKAILMQHYIDQQARRSKLILALHTIASDAYKYGIGIGAVSWSVKRAPGVNVERSLEESLVSRSQNLDLNIPERILYEGNEVKAIDPYIYLPDPSYECYDVQNMEHIGWIYPTNRFALLKEEKVSEGSRFNARYLEHMLDGRSTLTLSASDGRTEKTLVDRKTKDTLYSNPVDVITKFIDLIPSDWGLGDSDEVETWMFEIVGDEVIIGAGPTDLAHGMKPAFAMSPDYDGHSAFSPSRMEIDYPMQHSINYLYNNHIANLRKAVNNMLVVDPGLANYNDVVDTREGAVIRMRKAVWGLGRVKEAVAQLPINDVTRGNMADAAFLMQLEDRVTGAESAVSGQIHPKRERISSTETRQAIMSSLQRLEKDARVMYTQGYYDMAFMFAWHVVQFMQEETFVKMGGDLPADLTRELGVEKERAKVGPDLFKDMRWDVLPSDGTLPGAQGDPSSLNQFLQIVLSNQEVVQEFDVVRIAAQVARGIGVRNVSNFRRRLPLNATVAPEDEIEEQTNNGNLVPVGALGG